MVKRNNAITKNHFHKHWNPSGSQRGHIITFFDQPAQKKARRNKRAAKAARMAPRPVSGPLRPVVHCPTQRHNMRVRLGKGFSIEELKKAGIPKKYARTVGIAVDHRRRNLSEESLNLNSQRLKAYLEKLIVYPRNTKKAKKGDATKEQIAAYEAAAKEHKGPRGNLGEAPAVAAAVAPEAPRPLTDLEKKWRVYEFMRKNRRFERIIGYQVKRKARKEDKDKAAAAFKKK